MHEMKLLTRISRMREISEVTEKRKKRTKLSVLRDDFSLQKALNHVKVTIQDSNFGKNWKLRDPAYPIPSVGQTSRQQEPRQFE